MARYVKNTARCQTLNLAPVTKSEYTHAIIDPKGYRLLEETPVNSAVSKVDATPIISHPISTFSGSVRVPGDKSISHRSLIFGALSVGETVIHGLLEGEDILATGRAMAALGAEVTRDKDGVWHVHGRGVGGLKEPDIALDFGNAGTGVRLVMGVCAGHPFTSFMVGDASLHKRPMARITKPLETMGARFLTRSGGRLPVAVTGTDAPLPITYTLPVASAQVKSAVLLCGLMSPGHTTVIEPEPTRDHTEHMLRHFGATVDVADRAEGRVITLQGQPELTGQTVVVPGDPSSGAFLAALAAGVPGSHVTIQNVLMSPTRAGFYQTLEDMGAQVTRSNPRMQQGEPVADIVVQGAALHGVTVPEDRTPSMIDEYPVLSVLAAGATGPTVMNGAAELRVKESDRLAAVARGLEVNGVMVEEREDGMTVHGQGTPVPGGGTVTTHMDHRIAMSFLVLGALAQTPVTVDDGAFINTSFPGFVDLMNSLGAHMKVAA